MPTLHIIDRYSIPPWSRPWQETGDVDDLLISLLADYTQQHHLDLALWTDEITPLHQCYFQADPELYSEQSEEITKFDTRSADLGAEDLDLMWENFKKTSRSTIVHLTTAVGAAIFWDWIQEGRVFRTRYQKSPIHYVHWLCFPDSLTLTNLEFYLTQQSERRHWSTVLVHSEATEWTDNQILPYSLALPQVTFKHWQQMPWSKLAQILSSGEEISYMIRQKMWQQFRVIEQAQLAIEKLPVWPVVTQSEVA